MAQWLCLAATSAIGATTAKLAGYGQYEDPCYAAALVAAPFLVSAPIYRAYNIAQVFKKFGMTESIVLKPLEKLYVTAFVDNTYANYPAQLPVKVTIHDPASGDMHTSTVTAIFNFALPNYYYLAK